MKRPLRTRFAKAPWLLKIVCSVLVFYLVFGLIAAVAWFIFGHDAEGQLVNVVADLTEIVAIVLVPILLIGLIVVPLHRWFAHKLTELISGLDHRPKT
jgi:hypothetical protein